MVADELSVCQSCLFLLLPLWFISSADRLCVEPGFCQAAERVHRCKLGPTDCCHGDAALTPQELCRLVEDIINNKGLAAKVARGSV